PARRLPRTAILRLGRTAVVAPDAKAAVTRRVPELLGEGGVRVLRCHRAELVVLQEPGRLVGSDHRDARLRVLRQDDLRSGDRRAAGAGDHPVVRAHRLLATEVRLVAEEHVWMPWIIGGDQRAPLLRGAAEVERGL